MNEFLRIIAAGLTLSSEQAAAAMHLLLRGESSVEETAGLLMGLRGRGETLDELTAFTRIMREYAVPVQVADPNVIDVVGTGGDGSGTFNISTATMFVCSGAGATVAKHGNRSVSSRCGSADVLAELGVFVELPADAVERCIADAGLGFMFAPLFHPAMRHVMPVRRALGARTFFNILGPLSNPAGVRRGVFGAFSGDVARASGEILARLGSERIFAVHSEDGLDEFSVAAPTSVRDHQGSRPANVSTVRPEELGLPSHPLERLKGGDASTNASIIRAMLGGEAGGPRDVVLLNAAYGLVAAGIATNPAEGIARARESIDSGAAAASLERMAAASHDHRPR